MQHTMPNPMNTQLKQLHTRPSQRGSVVILTVVSLVLMVVLAMTFLQIAKVQRREVIPPPKNIDKVYDAVKDLIATRMAEDVFNQDGVFFGPGVEPYDFPWTNHDVVWDENVTDLAGNALGQPTGGYNDDQWLASSYVINDPNAGGEVWQKITNLTGIYVENRTDADYRTLANKTIRERLINASDPVAAGGDINSDMYIVPEDTNAISTLVDTDGDKIGDSRWARAPLPLIEGTQYFMSVRIVDASSLINANIAMGATSGGLDTYGGSPNTDPTGTTPVDLNLSRLAFLTGGASTNIDLLNQGRANNGDTSGPNPFGALPNVLHDDPDGTDLDTRFDWWFLGGRFTNSGRYKPSTGVDTATRANWNDEWVFRINNGVGAIDNYDPDANYDGYMAEAFDGWTGDNSTADGYSDFVGFAGPNAWVNYFRFNPRTMLTTFNGSADWATPAWSSSGAQFPVTTSRVPAFNFASPAFNAQNPTVADLTEVLVGNGSIGQYGLAMLVRDFYEGSTDIPATVTGNSLSYGVQLAANLRDYADSDNLMTVLDIENGQPKVYGMEAWPFMAEIYVQQKYEVSRATPLPDDGDPATDPEWDLTWTRVENEGGFAIEIRNPFNRRISLENIEVWIKDVGDNDHAQLAYSGDASQTTLADMVEAHGNNRYLDVNEVLFLYVEDADGSNAIMDSVAGNTESTWYTSLTGTNSTIEVPVVLAGTNTEWPEDQDGAATGPLNAERVTVELRVRTMDTNEYLVYNRMDTLSTPEEYVEEGVSFRTDPTNAVTDYLQIARRGSGEGLNAMFYGNPDVAGTVLHFAQAQINPDVDNDTRDTDLIQLGLSTKAGVASGPLSDPNQQIVIADHGPLGIQHAGELALIAALGPQAAAAGDDNLVAVNDVLARESITHTDELRLNLDTAPDWTSGDDRWNINRAQLLLSKFSTLSAFRDGQDNDGDGKTDENSEQLVQGRINLNTVHPEVLAHAMPYPMEHATALNFGQMLEDYRIGAARTSTSSTRQDMGLETTWELWGELSQASFAYNPEAEDGGSDDQTHPVTSVVLDRINGYDDPAANPWTGGQRDAWVTGNADADQATDGVYDDREEKLVLLNWLSQVATTRSDVYIAFIKIDGYESDDPNDLTQLGKTLESMRAVVVFSRANLVNNGDRPEVLAEFIYP